MSVYRLMVLSRYIISHPSIFEYAKRHSFTQIFHFVCHTIIIYLNIYTNEMQPNERINLYTHTLFYSMSHLHNNNGVVIVLNFILKLSNWNWKVEGNIHSDLHFAVTLNIVTKGQSYVIWIVMPGFWHYW